MSCLLQYIRERLKGRDDIDTRRIFITESGGFTPEELAGGGRRPQLPAL